MADHLVNFFQDSFFQDSFFQNNETALLILGVFSVVSFFITLAIIPWLVLQLPKDYFAHSRRFAITTRKFPAGIHFLFLLLKNLFGLVIIVLGILMLVIPGQGLLTIVIGLVLIDFPGKYRLQRSLIMRKPLLKTVNWLRERGHEPPLEFGDSTHLD